MSYHDVPGTTPHWGTAVSCGEFFTGDTVWLLLWLGVGGELMLGLVLRRTMISEIVSI